MKKTAIILSTLFLVTFNGISQKVEVKGLLEKPETRSEIFNTILNDHQLMMEFMQEMKGNEHASMMMQNEKPQMGEMMGSNPDMMKKMMGNMMDMCEKDSVMRSTMVDMMTQHPEMMKCMKQKMEDKGKKKKDDKPSSPNKVIKQTHIH